MYFRVFRAKNSFEWYIVVPFMESPTDSKSSPPEKEQEGEGVPHLYGLENRAASPQGDAIPAVPAGRAPDNPPNQDQEKRPPASVKEHPTIWRSREGRPPDQGMPSVTCPNQGLMSDHFFARPG